MSIKIFSQAYLDDLVLESSLSPRLRQHRNIHTDYEERCQRFFNAIQYDSYLRPHKHSESQGDETLVAIRGLLALVTFSNSGVVEEICYFGDGLRSPHKAIAVGVGVPPGKWHTVLSLEKISVLLEVKAGPFDPGSPKLPAPWAPDEGGDLAAAYLMSLRKVVLQGFPL
jgi:cupin fold WbuC family metalloprotein